MATQPTQRSIIMHFREPPSDSDLQSLAEELMDSVPDELADFCADLRIVVEDFPSSELEAEMELEDSFDLLALYRSGSEKIPGVESKLAANTPTLLLFRRPILDVWCETHDDLTGLIRHIMVTEIATANGFSAAEGEALALRHQQGLF